MTKNCTFLCSFRSLIFLALKPSTLIDVLFDKFINLDGRVWSARVIGARWVLHRLVAPIFNCFLSHSNWSFAWCWWHCVLGNLSISCRRSSDSTQLAARSRFHLMDDVGKVFWCWRLIDCRADSVRCRNQRFESWRACHQWKKCNKNVLNHFLACYSPTTVSWITGSE